MYGGRRPIVAQFPAANNPPTAAICSGGGGSDCGLRQISGAADPSGAVDFDRMINCRVTSVIDPTSFWAQVGEGNSLEEFDAAMVSMCQWCEEYNRRAVLLPRVGELISVRGTEPGKWVRAKVSRQVSENHVEVLYVDTGTTGRVALTRMCGGSPPQLYSIPAQAVQGSLHGVQPVCDSEDWSEAAIKHFTDLVTGVTIKAKMMMQPISHNLTFQLYTRRDEMWVSICDMMVTEGLAVLQPTEVQQATPTTPPLPTEVHQATPTTPPFSTSEEEEEEEEESVEDEAVENVCLSEKSPNPPLLSTEIVVKPETVEPVEDEENGEEEEEDAEDKTEEESETDNTTHDETSDEWDDSILEPIKDIDISKACAVDPFTPVQSMVHSQAYNHTQSQIMGVGRRGRSHGRGRGGGGGSRGGVWKTPWKGPGGRGGSGHYLGREGIGAGGGERKGSAWREGGGELGGRKRGGGWTGRTNRGRGRSYQRSDQEQYGLGTGSREGEYQGGMRGVNVTTKQVPVLVEMVGPVSRSPAKEPKPLPNVAPPPSTEPVELFMKDSEAGGGSRRRQGTNGGDMGKNETEGYTVMGMNEETTKNEIQWHRWKIEEQVKKILESLDPENIDRFGTEIQTLLSNHGSAQKLMSLPGSRGPVWPVISCLLLEGSKRKEGRGDKTIVMALRTMAGVLSVDVCQLLQPVVEEIASDVCEQPSYSERAKQTKQLFCRLIGKLFLDASYSQFKDYAAVMGRIVRYFLNIWSKCPVEGQESELLAQVESFGYLSDQIGPTIDITNRDTLEQYFSGVVRNNILNTQLPRSVCGNLLDLSLKRASGWHEEKTDQTEDVPHIIEPSLFSQQTPTLSANGQPVLQPLPIEASTKTHDIVKTSTPISHHQHFNQSQMIPQTPTAQNTQYAVPHNTVSSQPGPNSTTIPNQPTTVPYSNSTTVPYSHSTTVPYSNSTTVPYQHVPPTVIQTTTPLQSNYTQFNSQYVPQSVNMNSPGHYQHQSQHSDMQPSHSGALPSGIHPLNQMSHRQHSVTFSTIEEMLHTLSLSHLVDSFKTAMISDSVLECGNVETLRGGLKDAGLHPGEVITVLDYLQRRRTANPTQPHFTPTAFSSNNATTMNGSVPTTPSTPYSNQFNITPPQYSNQQPPLQRQYSSHHPSSPMIDHTPTPTAQLPPQQHQQYQPPQYNPSNQRPPTTRLQHQYSDPNLTTNHPSPSTIYQHPSQTQQQQQQQQQQEQHHPISNDQSADSLPSQPPSQPPQHRQYSHPFPPTPSPNPSPIVQVPQSHPPPIRLPTPALTNDQHSSAEKYGFGQFSCVLCCSTDHTTDRCPDRQRLLFTHSAIY